MSLQPDIAMTVDGDGLSASEIAQAVADRKITALAVTEAALARIANRVIPQLLTRVRIAHEAHRKAWFEMYKPNGWEVIDEHHLTKTFKFPDFVKALAFVNRVGSIAETPPSKPDEPHVKLTAALGPPP